jgi:hypothetical protein
MAIWSRPLKWVKSKIRPARPAPPAPPPPGRRPPPPPPDDGAFDRLHYAYLVGRLRELGMDSVDYDVLAQELGLKNAIKVLDKTLDRVRDHIADRPSPFAGEDNRLEAWEDDAEDDIKRYTPKGQLPNYRALMPFWWYHPTHP